MQEQLIVAKDLPHSPQITIDKVLPDTIYIRTSERLLFRRCRRLWGWSSPLKMHLEVANKPDYFWFGTGMHYSLEDFHGVNHYGHPARAFMAYQRATLAAGGAPAGHMELTQIGVDMMSYYADYWLKVRGRDPLTTYVHNGVPQCEVRFTIDMPIKGPQGQKVVYRGQFDRVIVDNEGNLWIHEYKSAKSFRMDHFDTDDQVTAYCWAGQAIYGRPIMGVVYQQHKKTLPHAPRILKNGEVSVAKNQCTSYSLYRQALLNVYGDPSNFPADNLEYLNTLVLQEEHEADPYIRRDRLYRNQHQIAAQGEKILLEVEEMLREGLALYPNPSKDCSWLCPLESVCVAMDDGSDFSGLLESLTVPREEDTELWRTLLPDPQILPQIAERPEIQAADLMSAGLPILEDSKMELLEMLGLEW